MSQESNRASSFEQQCGFRNGRVTIDQVWVVRHVIEKVIEHDSSVHICFVDLSEAIDSVPVPSFHC